MKTERLWMLSTLLLAGGLLIGLLLGPSPGTAQGPQQDYTLSWWTVDGGGETWSTDGRYRLGGTTGQPDAGLLAAANYTLGGGFWEGGALVAALYNVYLPLVLRNGP
jgi:hypothetical protein